MLCEACWSSEAVPQRRPIGLPGAGSLVVGFAELGDAGSVRHAGFAGAAVPPARRGAAVPVPDSGSVKDPVWACLTRSCAGMWIGSGC